MHKYECDICKRKLKKKYSLQGYTLCAKHMHQLHKHGKFLDAIPRTNNDPNDYIIKGDIAIFNLYNQHNIKIGEFIIDAEDVDKVKYHKWRIGHDHILTGNHWKGKNRIKDLAWVVLDIQDIENNVVDHINNNTFDNRKCNLRICTQNENTKNVSIATNNTSGYSGVYKSKRRNKWVAEIKVNYKKIHLGEYKELKDAVYARMIAEALYFKNFKNNKEFEKKKQFTQQMSTKRKKEIANRITTKYNKFN